MGLTAALGAAVTAAAPGAAAAGPAAAPKAADESAEAPVAESADSAAPWGLGRAFACSACFELALGLSHQLTTALLLCLSGHTPTYRVSHKCAYFRHKTLLCLIWEQNGPPSPVLALLWCTTPHHLVMQQLVGALTRRLSNDGTADHARDFLDAPLVVQRRDS